MIEWSEVEGSGDYEKWLKAIEEWEKRLPPCSCGGKPTIIAYDDCREYTSVLDWADVIIIQCEGCGASVRRAVRNPDNPRDAFNNVVAKWNRMVNDTNEDYYKHFDDGLPMCDHTKIHCDKDCTQCIYPIIHDQQMTRDIITEELDNLRLKIDTILHILEEQK